MTEKNESTVKYCGINKKLRLINTTVWHYDVTCLSWLFMTAANSPIVLK